jgi:hypothetical protein
MPLPSIPDYSAAIKTPQLVHPNVLKGGHPVVKGVNTIKYSGGFCVVFPYETPTKKYAVRCWHADVSDAKKRTQLIAETLKKCTLPYFVGFEYYEDGIMTPVGKQPVVVMDWVNASPLKKYIASHLNEPDTLNHLAESFKTMVSDLHKQQLSHGDLQHGNIMVKDDGSLILVDYDSMYVPSLKGMKDEIKGLVGYQHTARWKNDVVTEKADYFSELVIYTSLKVLAADSSYWQRLNFENSETMLFSGDDIESGGKSPIFGELRKKSDIKPMIDTLCEFMAFDSIDNLVPLEQAVVSKTDTISSKWAAGNSYKPSKPHVDNPDEIKAKWGAGNGYKPPTSKEQADSIGSKWKK